MERASGLCETDLAESQPARTARYSTGGRIVLMPTRDEDERPVTRIVYDGLPEPPRRKPRTSGKEITVVTPIHLMPLTHRRASHRPVWKI